MALSTPRDVAPPIRLIGDVRKDFGVVLVAMAESQMRDSLDTNVQSFGLISDNAVRHTPTKVLHQKPHTVVLREREDVETDTLLTIKGPQCANRCSEPIGG